MDSGYKINISVIPLQVRQIMERLNRNCHRSYLVGGVVRDIIQGREPKDYDIATSATPGQVRGLFARVISTGERHGTVTIIKGGLGVEATTLRRDGKYSDCRRPDSVEFTGSLKEDLSRRDFTINSLAADLEGNVYDFFGGLGDISEGIIRAVGDPGRRFREDGLRMMRAIRFASQTGFAIEDQTLLSITANQGLISRVSMERIRDEFSAILVSALPRKGVELISGCGLMSHIIPEMDSLTVKNYTLLMAVLENTPVRLNVRLAGLLSFIAGDRPSLLDPEEFIYRSRREDTVNPVEEILCRLKYDRKTITAVNVLAGERITENSFTNEKSIKRLMGRVGVENLEELFELWQAIAAADRAEGVKRRICQIEKTVEVILSSKQPILVKDLALNGNDLKKIGIRPGREMGLILQRLLDIVLDKPEMNEKDVLMGIVRRGSTNIREEKKE
ncbi:MAG: CCA tRNA nucleotidyltransferase [Desulfocucumaceae bacterium]